jgi:hypothetical protein
MPSFGPSPAALRPAAEAGEVGGQRRHADRERFLRRVAPRLVVARVGTEVHRRQHRLVLASEQAVVGPQVDRHLHDLDAAAEPVVEAEALAVRVHRIAFLVEQVVRAQADRPVRGPAGEPFEQFGAHAAVAGRHQQERDHAAPLVLLQLRQRVEQQLDALVVELVAAREREERRVGDVLAEHRLGDARQLGPRLAAIAGGELVDHGEVDAVRQQRLALRVCSSSASPR